MNKKKMRLPLGSLWNISVSLFRTYLSYLKWTREYPTLSYFNVATTFIGDKRMKQSNQFERKCYSSQIQFSDLQILKILGQLTSGLKSTDILQNNFKIQISNFSWKIQIFRICHKFIQLCLLQRCQENLLGQWANTQ